MSAKLYLRKELPFRQLFYAALLTLLFTSTMKKNDFMNQWLKLDFKQIKSRKKESAIIRFGHMNHHVFSHQDPVNELSLSHFLRIMINYAMLAEHTDKMNEFMVYWTKLGIELQVFAESDAVDEFNEQFASESKNHSKHPIHF